MEAQQKARKGQRVKPEGSVAAPAPAAAKVTDEVKPAKKVTVVRKKSTPVPTTAASPPPLPPTSTVLFPTKGWVETLDEPIQVQGVNRIVLRPFPFKNQV